MGPSKLGSPLPARTRRTATRRAETRVSARPSRQTPQASISSGPSSCTAASYNPSIRCRRPPGGPGAVGPKDGPVPTCAECGNVCRPATPLTAGNRIFCAALAAGLNCVAAATFGRNLPKLLVAHRGAMESAFSTVIQSPLSKVVLGYFEVENSASQ